MNTSLLAVYFEKLNMTELLRSTGDDLVPARSRDFLGKKTKESGMGSGKAGFSGR